MLRMGHGTAQVRLSGRFDGKRLVLRQDPVSEGEVMVEIVGAERPLRASGEVEFASGSLRLMLTKGEGWLEW